MPLEIGRHFGPYEILSFIGEGGMGAVYKARDTRLDRVVALKALPAEAMADPERQRRLVQEAKAASALNHPNIVQVYDIVTAENTDFIVMEYVPGRTLGTLVGRKGLRLEELLRFAIQMADALAAAHRAGIIHRDLKPANVMVTESGQIKLLDFGLAKITSLAGPAAAETEEIAAMGTRIAPPTQAGVILGTLAYMSPEQAQGKAVAARSDIFSFGSVLYEMATGRRAFQGDSQVSTLTSILRDEPKLASKVAYGIPRDLEKIITLCLRKDPARRFQHMEDIKTLLEELKEESDSGKMVADVPDVSPKSRRRLYWLVAVVSGAGLLAASAGLVWWVASRHSPRAAQHILTRLTSDSGLTTDPALSPDGRLVAYASDRSGEGNLDIWLRQVAGGDPIRLTRHPTDAIEPSFSPDGSTLVFQSRRADNGIYAIPALGGDERLLAMAGKGPRFSPDGRWVAYWWGNPDMDAKLYVVPSTGGPPRQVQSDFHITAWPLWTPDSKRLLFWGIRDSQSDSLDWWVAPLEGGAPIRTGAAALFRQHGIRRATVIPSAWDNGDVIFSAEVGDATNLWRVAVSPTSWHVTGEPTRLTSGASREEAPSVAAYGSPPRIAFASLTFNLDVWSLALDANRGKALGQPQRLTQDAAEDIFHSVSADGNHVVFTSTRSGTQTIWLKDLETGREGAVTQGTSYAPAIRPDGSKIAFAVLENERQVAYMISTGPGGTSGLAEKLCVDCVPCHWSADGTKLLVATGLPARVNMITLMSKVTTEVARHPTYNLMRPRFSPDGRWITFHATIGPGIRQIFVAPVSSPPAPMSQWIPVTDATTAHFSPDWSPDGNVIYFLSRRDGFTCLWSQSLDGATKRPIGLPVAVYHFHRARLTLENPETFRIGIAREKVLFSLAELTGNIWMMQPDLNQR